MTRAHPPSGRSPARHQGAIEQPTRGGHSIRREAMPSPNPHHGVVMPAVTRREGIWHRATADLHRPTYDRGRKRDWLAAVATRHRVGIAAAALTWMFLLGYAITRLIR